MPTRNKQRPPHLATAEGIVAHLRTLANADHRDGMAHFGIDTTAALGISVPALRKTAREIGRDHALAQELWATRIHEARILAAMSDEPAKVTRAQMERWVRDFDSWDVCDGVCGDLFDRTPYGWEKAAAWAARKPEFVRRAGFALMAYLAVHDKTAPDERFLALLPVIKSGASDDRNFVKKAVNWALRQIGKRNAILNAAAIATARDIATVDSRAARWIAADALRELTSAAVQVRLSTKSPPTK